MIGPEKIVIVLGGVASEQHLLAESLCEILNQWASAAIFAYSEEALRLFRFSSIRIAIFTEAASDAQTRYNAFFRAFSVSLAADLTADFIVESISDAVQELAQAIVFLVKFRKGKAKRIGDALILSRDGHSLCEPLSEEDAKTLLAPGLSMSSMSLLHLRGTRIE